MQTAPFIADPARDADIEAEIEIGARFLDACSETMRHAGKIPELSQHRQKVFMCVALMQEHGLAQFACKFELRPECSQLRIAWRIVAEIIEAAFTDGDDSRRLRERCEFLQLRLSQFARMMRMNTSGATQDCGIRLRQFDGLSRACDGTAGDD